MVKGVVRVPESAGGGISRRAIFRVPDALPIPDKGCRRFSPGAGLLSHRRCAIGTEQTDGVASPDVLPSIGRLLRTAFAGLLPQGICADHVGARVLPTCLTFRRGGPQQGGGAAIEGATAERMWEPSRKWNRNRGGVTKRGCNRGEPQQGGRNRRGSRMGCRRGGSHCRLGAVTGRAGPQPERCGPETDGNGDRNCKKRRP